MEITVLEQTLIVREEFVKLLKLFNEGYNSEKFQNNAEPYEKRNVAIYIFEIERLLKNHFALNNRHPFDFEFYRAALTIDINKNK